VGEAGERVPDPGHLALEQRARGDEDAPVADGKPLADGLRPERREQGAEGGPVLPRAKRSGVQGWNPAGEAEDAFAGADPELAEDVRKAVGLFLEFRVGDVARLPTAGEPADGDAPAAAGRNVAIDGLVSDVERATGEPVGMARWNGLAATVSGRRDRFRFRRFRFAGSRLREGAGARSGPLGNRPPTDGDGGADADAASPKPP